MDIQDIVKNKDRQMVFPVVLEEACRQWCDFFPEDPERMRGEGFANFFFEIFEQKEAEYILEAKETAAGRQEKQTKKPSIKKDLQGMKAQKHPCTVPAKDRKPKQPGMEL